LKKYFLGLVSGLLIAAVLIGGFAVAQNMQVDFNTVAIVVNSVPVAGWGENHTLADGTEAPYSITYNGTTYLSMRRMAEIFGKDIFWNGDSRTVSLNEKFDSRNEIFLAEEPDKNGNIWRYTVRTSTANRRFLAVSDDTRGFTRIYGISGNVFVADDGIYFVRFYERDMFAALYNISFLNDENTQDGKRIYSMYARFRQAVIEDGYVYYIQTRGLNSAHDVLVAHNWRTGESIDIFSAGRWVSIRNLTLLRDENGDTILQFDTEHSAGGRTEDQQIRVRDHIGGDV